MVMKKVLFAVAGAGKTKYLVDKLSQAGRCLLLTYTENNAHNLEIAILKKFKKVPDNIFVSTYFSFLLNFMIKPFLLDEGRRIRRLHYSKKPIPRYLKGVDRFVTGAGEEVFHSRAFHFACEFIGNGKLFRRIAQFFDSVFIDEVQDFAGYDFDFIEMLGQSTLNVLLAGDFFQHTFDTSRDGSKNQSLHDDYLNYKKRFDALYTVDEQTLSNSFRCPQAICDFVSSTIGIQMGASNQVEVNPPCLVADASRIDEIMNDDRIEKLFYQKSYEYSCKATNWGVCKGLSFDDVCVVLNSSTYDKFAKGDVKSLAPSTRNKFYVACTRTKGNLYFVKEEDVTAFRKKTEEQHA